MNIDFENDCIDLSVSLQSFDSKPNTYYGLTYEQKSITINQFLYLITTGHCFCYNFKSSRTQFGLNEKTIANFLSTSLLWIDIDDSEYDITTVCNKLRYKPSIAYTTFSNGIKGNRFRFIYLLNFSINDIDKYQDYIHIIYSSIKKDIDNDLFIDEKCLNVSQQFLGTNRDAIILLNNEYYYDIELLDKIKLENNCTKNNDSINNIYNEKRERIITKNNKIGTDKREIINKALDIYNSENFHPVLSNASKFQHDICDVYSYVGDCDIYEIRRWYDVNNKMYCNVKEGNRNKMLFVFGLIEKNINPDIKIEELAASLYWLYNNYCDVTDDMGINEIVNIALGVMTKHDSDLGKRKYLLNPIYNYLPFTEKLRQVGAAKRKLRNTKVINNYDFNKTIKENAEIIGMSCDTIRAALKDMGHKLNNEKFERFKEIYINNKSLSIRQLSSICKISKNTVQSYIKRIKSENPNENTD